MPRRWTTTQRLLPIAISASIIILLSACAQPTPEIIKETVIVHITEPPAPTYTSYPTYTAVPPAATYTPLPTYTPQAPLPTYTPLSTHTPYPTYTKPPKPTDTPGPTNTLKPTKTSTPRPTDTPQASQQPILLTGSGGSVVDVEKNSMGALVHVVGNAAGKHFAVTNYGAGGKRYDLLVNTTEPYDGIRPIDFLDKEHTTRFEVSATGTWTITIIPFDRELLQDRTINSPGTYKGTGDDVFFILGDCDLAIIKGNDTDRYFGVVGWYSKGRDGLVNTTEPYEGTVIMKRDTFAIEVRAIGSWSIEITVP